MSDHTQCPIPVRGGRDCWRQPHPDARFGLCAEHWIGIVADWCADSPTTTIRCTGCGTLQQFNTAEMVSVACRECGRVIREAGWIVHAHDRVRALEGEVEHVPVGVVYYIRFGNRIKIGFTTGIVARLENIPNDEVLAVERGPMSVERERHAQFADTLVSGQREWFTASPALVDHINALRQQFPDPVATALTWDSERAREMTVTERALLQGGRP